MKRNNQSPFRPRIPGTNLTSDDVPTAIIYRPARSATTSAPFRGGWVLELEPSRPKQIDPLMGWTTSEDPYQPIRLTFPDRDSAVEYAMRNDMRYIVREDRVREPEPNPWAGKSAHELYKGAQAPGSWHIRSRSGLRRDENKEFDPVLEADLESFPASDPPAWTGVTVARRRKTD